MIIDHTKRPRNFRVIDHPDRTARGHNPLCGDKLTLYLTLRDGRIADVAFQGEGCSISTASASLMTEAIKGKTVAEAQDLFHRFHETLTAPPDQPAPQRQLGKLAVLEGVRRFPVRVKCATLPWHTLAAALKQAPTPVSTE